jgi:hypothetical protein
MADFLGMMKQAAQLQAKMKALTGGLPLPPGMKLF